MHGLTITSKPTMYIGRVHVEPLLIVLGAVIYNMHGHDQS